MKDKLKNAARKVVGKLFRILFKVFSRFPRNEKLVIFESFHGKQYSCNPRAIYEYMLQEDLDYEMYWSMNKKDAVKYKGENLHVLQRFSLQWIYKMATAKYWVINARLPQWIEKPKGTVYLQTWHGTPLKKLGQDITDVKMPGTTTEKYRSNFIKESSKWDYLIAPNLYSKDIFKHAFSFKKEIILSGYPRNDLLHKNNNLKEIDLLKTKYGLPLNKKIILYAPTWRDDEYLEVGKYKFSLKLDLEKMQKKLGEEYIILTRMHYLIAEYLDLSQFKGFAYDVSNNADIRELYLISDLLITDYSSVFFDYANLKRPILFFAYDLEKYKDELRGFYFDFENLAPGPIVETTDDLLKEIGEITVADSQDNLVKMKRFFDQYCSLEDGYASKRVVEKLFK
ncbi:CDP-glycerol glycerophosphotransferase family protein [Jeotgalibacillus proteolyticus]|uniref:CDP-glycerol--glycerophosphate glycerophosphotransferase n=1 Tax=Jeotgalibacillus proteolyticus TaxID=2082395 RepID=A0A2S5GBB5_9BACL|nr:CDP-glycerol glycerophosphotransferase family protein [Jeotgalibacillus proteolyticus]PPA70290.1 CDP-glycerol--glycerophosphate glycerophosphotransferase [Jeotgalibacillus proteolyticus]